MSRHVPALLLAVLLVAAGCVSVGPSADAGGRSATVTRVIDGDTIEVRFGDGTTDTVRLLGVDAPEVGGTNEPGEFEGVPDTEAGRRCLDDSAEAATSFADRHLARATVEVVTDPIADRRGDYGRLLAYVELSNGTDLNYRLVEAGHARVYDSTFSRSEEFYAAESRAQAERRGLWRCREPGTAGRSADSPLRVVAVHSDAAGDDRANLGDEYVRFRNGGGTTLELGGWRVRDEGGHVYAFPANFTLPANATVTLVTGPGTDGPETLYWDEDGPVWNNGGDSVTVTNETGAIVVEYVY